MLIKENCKIDESSSSQSEEGEYDINNTNNNRIKSLIMKNN